MFRVASGASLNSLRSAINDSGADLIIPCDDDAVWDLHALWKSDPSLRPLIEDSLGSAEHYPIVESRELLLETAINLGIRVPESHGIAKEDDLASWDFQDGAVLKLDGTCGGTGVVIVRSHAEAVSAFRELSSLRQKRSNARVTMQRFVEGRPANTMFACWSGELLGIGTVEVVASKGRTGAAIVIGTIESEEIKRAAELLSKKLCLNGFCGLDFILEEKTGRPYLLEMNPRMTQLGHLPLSRQGNLARVLGAKLRGATVVPPVDYIRERTIALFPHALQWDRKKQYLRSSFHDTPMDDPDLYQALLRDAWPERTGMRRLYHTLGLPRWRKMFTWGDQDRTKTTLPL